VFSSSSLLLSSLWNSCIKKTHQVTVQLYSQGPWHQGCSNAKVGLCLNPGASLSLSLSSSLSSYIFAFPLKTKERFNQVCFFNKENLLLFPPLFFFSLSLSLFGVEWGLLGWTSHPCGLPWSKFQNPFEIILKYIFKKSHS